MLASTSKMVLVALAFATTARASELRRDVEYGRASDERLLLDVSVPDGPGPFPIAILVHGGGWSRGSKAGGDGSADISPWFETFTRAGYTWFSIDYRLAPKHPWPAAIDDVRTAIRWVKAHAKEYKGDPARIALVGHSAGGHLVALAGTTAGDDTRVQAVVGFAAVTDFDRDVAFKNGVSTSLQALFGVGKDPTQETMARLREASPIARVGPSSTHYLLIHGDADQSVAFDMSPSFQAKVRAEGGTADLIVVKGGPHSIVGWETIDTSYKPAMVEWLRRYLAPQPSTWEKTVAQDGSGDFRTVQEAIAAAPTGSAENPSIIRIKPGTYKEVLYVQHEKRFLRLLGEDAKTTVLTYNLHANMTGLDGKPIGTFRTPSAVIDADDLTAENLTFENSAGPVGQALAIRIDGDRVVFRRCRFLGWQDTIFANRGRHYFEDCVIEGHVDFIFGAATMWFERCLVRCLRNGYVTAASTPKEQPYGYVFNRCRIVGENADVKTYLGRPWRDFAAVVFLNTEMSDVVRPVGWHNWDKPERETTSRYAEFGTTGTGASTTRVPWAKALTAAEAAAYTVERVLGGADDWRPR